jgi:hypothetical protein
MGLTGRSGRPVRTAARPAFGREVEPAKANQSNVGRPISIVDKAARPLKEVVASR